MTKVEFRRWVVHIVELTIKYGTAMCIMSAGCILVVLFVGASLKALGVA